MWAKKGSKPEPIRDLAVHRSHNWGISNGHGALIDTSAPEQTFTGTPEALRARLTQFEAAGATGVIFGTSGAVRGARDVG